MTDDELLSNFGKNGDEDAFSQLVHRHIDWVYSTAYRRLCHEANARDVTQQVFTLLAKNALQLIGKNRMTGWLYRTCRNLCLEHIRRDLRRQAREKQAGLQMKDDPESDPWITVAPHLEPAIDKLSESDRIAILLRFFENKSLRDVGQALGLNETAAQKRVTRAVDKLRGILGERGIPVSSMGLSGILLSQTVQTAPSGLAAIIATQGLSAISTTLTTMHVMNIFNIKTTSIMLGIAVTTATGTYLSQQNIKESLRKENQSLVSTNQHLQTTNEGLLAKIDSQSKDNERLRNDLKDLHRLRNEVTQSRNLAAQLAEMKNLNRNLLKTMKAIQDAADQVDAMDTASMVIEPGVGLGSIKLGMAMNEVIEILGEPGMRIGSALQYVKGGFAILPGGDKETVGAIMIGDSSGGTLVDAFKGSTQTGISMGATREKIVESLGEPMAHASFSLHTTPSPINPKPEYDAAMVEAFFGEPGHSSEEMNLAAIEAKQGFQSLEYPSKGLTFTLKEGKLVHITLTGIRN